MHGREHGYKKARIWQERWPGGSEQGEINRDNDNTKEKVLMIIGNGQGS